MTTLQAVGMIVGITGGMLTVMTVLFGRYIRRAEEQAVNRDKALAVVVQHFDPESELTKHVGGTLPERVIEIVATLEHIGGIIDQDVMTRVERAEEKIDTHETRLDDNLRRINKISTAVTRLESAAT